MRWPTPSSADRQRHALRSGRHRPADRLRGNDLLIGGTGVNTLVGGLGDDTYDVNLLRSGTTGLAVLEDVVSEAAGQGNDTLLLKTAGNATLTSTPDHADLGRHAGEP